MIEKTTTYSRSANQNPGTAQPDKAPFSDGSGFTPGPWLRDGLTVYALDERKNANRFSFRVQEGYLHHTRHERIRTTAEELEATAAMAQAAPDMFEALRELVAAVDDGLCNSGVPGFDGARLDRALFGASAALSKATPTGEASDV